MSRSSSSDPAPRQQPALAPPPGIPRPAGADAGAAERLLRELLPVGGIAEMERRLVRGVRELSGATWAAYFRQDAEQLMCTAAEGAGPAAGEPLSPGLSARQEAWRGVRLCGGVAATEAGLPAEVQICLTLLDGERAALLLGPLPGNGAFPEALVATLAQLTEAFSTALQNASLIDRLRSQAVVDHLSNCYNRRGFEEHLRVEMVRARRYRRPLSLLLVDLDHFKSINDTLGHQAGDHVLRRVGAALLAVFRTTDVVCRYGGDEFAILFPETSKEDVLRLAERVRRQLGTLFPDAVAPGPISASLGVAGYPSDAAELEELVRAADHALYRAKEGGRNRVVAAGAEVR